MSTRTRRNVVAQVIGLTIATCARAAFSAAPETTLRDAVAQLERDHGGRLGVAMLDTRRADPVGYRGDERFPLCSTFKCLAAAFVLARTDRHQENLSRRVVYGKQDLIKYSPFTEQHLGEPGVTLAEICEAAVTLSDNTAGNLMLDSFGGPAALTDYLRSLGDEVTRLDRREPDLNEAAPGDARDTTSPVAMLRTLQRLVLGDALATASRERLTGWLLDSKVGEQRLRAGVPASWRTGEKTGTGRHNATNDVAVVWPPTRTPIVVTAYYVDSGASGAERDAVLAQVGRLATSGS